MSVKEITIQAGKRYTWLDIIKILACFFVIINHFHGQIFYFAGDTPTVAFWDSLIFAICKSAVPLFVMTSGYLLLNREHTWKSIGARILRIIVPLVALSAYYYIRFVGGSFLGFFQSLLSEPAYVHLWYLYMMVGLYLATAFLQKMVAHCSNRDLTIFTLVFLVLPGALDLCGIYLGWPVSQYFHYGFFPCAAAYYVAGVLLTRLPLKQSLFLATIPVYLLSIGGLCASFFVPYLKTGSIVATLDNWAALPVVCASLALFYGLRYLLENRDFSEKTVAFWGEVSATTFGIYLVHLFTLHEIIELGFVQRILSAMPWFGVFFVEISCFVLSSIVIFVLRKIPLAKRFL